MNDHVAPFYEMSLRRWSGDNIEQVKCPICNEELRGGNTDELNNRLSTHMADQHNMRRLPATGQRSASAGPSEYSQTRSERAVETFSGREPEYESAKSRREIEEATTWKSPRTGSERSMEPSKDVRHGGGWGHRMWHRYDTMNMSMACPMCDQPIYGSDEEDLSDELRFHFKDAHRDVMRR